MLDLFSYFTPKSSTQRQNFTLQVTCVKRPGVSLHTHEAGTFGGNDVVYELDGGVNFSSFSGYGTGAVEPITTHGKLDTIG